ncbi:MAG: hypothetical protein QOH57_3158 [Mycobacterium sp.]|jgi:hypothetical protein|nr:hypothetical protein [Mycobacterium sp.]
MKPGTVAVVALVVGWLVSMQVVASLSGFQGPLHSLASDYVATPVAGPVAWVGLGLAIVVLSPRQRMVAVLTAAALDALFAAARLLSNGVLAVGNGPLIVLTGLAVWVFWRWTGEQKAIAVRAIAYGFLLIIAVKIGDAWLHVVDLLRPTVLDQYVVLADHALGQPSWMFGRMVDMGGPAVAGVLHAVYGQLALAAMIVSIYQLRRARFGEWPRHLLVRSFLVLGLIGPVVYLAFPVIGPAYVFGVDGAGLQLGDYWPHVLPPTGFPPGVVPFDDSRARNCMPSMHTAWALAIFLHTRTGPRWLRWGGAFWLVGTVSATLGFGYHYGVDLIAGAVLCLTVESALREPVAGKSRVRLMLIAGGAASFAVLLGCFRYLAIEMARYPVFFGPLMIGLLAVLGVTFYATFFRSAEREATFSRTQLMTDLSQFSSTTVFSANRTLADQPSSSNTGG